MTLLDEFPSEGRFFYFWKGRVALYTLLKALDVGSGDEVILPGFTCVVVPNAVIYTGARPVYADIDRETYTVTAQTIEPLISPHTRVIITQNTFGLSPDMDPIMDLAARHGLTVIEDCAHGLGGYYKGRPAGSIAHASFFSTQWSKPVSTGLGGIAFVRDHSLIERVEHLMRQLAAPGRGEQLLLALQTWVRPLADNPALYYPLVDLYRLLTQRLGLSVGSSVGEELHDTRMPDGYLKGMGKRQRAQWERGLKRLPALVRRRQAGADYYDTFFASTSVRPPLRPVYAEHSMLRYTVRVPDNKQKALDRARKLRIPVGDWFVSPLHPVQGDLSPWHYFPGQCPEAERACTEVINLFPEKPLTEHQLHALFAGLI